MEYKNIQSPAYQNGMQKFPDETNIDYENDNDETLKKMGRQVED